MESKDPLDIFGFDETEAEIIDAEAELRKQQKKSENLDKRICGCGHPMSRHKPNPFVRNENIPDPHQCQMPNAGSRCTCKMPRPVLKVPNTKRFLMKPVPNTGSAGHPLLRGIRRVKEASEDEYRHLDWLVPILCEKCNSEDIKVSPVGVYVGGKIAGDNQAGDFTVFLCDNCRFPADTSENPVVDSEDSSDNPEL